MSPFQLRAIAGCLLLQAAILSSGWLLDSWVRPSDHRLGVVKPL